MGHINSVGRLSVGTEIRVLLVEDHPVVRRGMAGVIREQPDLRVCGEAANMAEAMRLLREHRPHVAVVDLGLGSGHGLELIEMIREQNKRARILVVSAQDERLYAERCLRAGAAGYLGKEASAEELIAAIRRVAAGEVALSSEMSNQLLHAMVGGAVKDVDPISTLSNRELEVFELIGNAQTTRQIAEHLVLSPKTVETHRENIKTKLGLTNTAELTRRAVEWVLKNH